MTSPARGLAVFCGSLACHEALLGKAAVLCWVTREEEVKTLVNNMNRAKVNSSLQKIY
jgi:hypothetical protein